MFNVRQTPEARSSWSPLSTHQLDPRHLPLAIFAVRHPHEGSTLKMRFLHKAPLTARQPPEATPGVATIPRTPLKGGEGRYSAPPTQRVVGSITPGFPNLILIFIILYSSPQHGGSPGTRGSALASLLRPTCTGSLGTGSAAAAAAADKPPPGTGARQSTATCQRVQWLWSSASDPRLGAPPV